MFKGGRRSESESIAPEDTEDRHVFFERGDFWEWESWISFTKEGGDGASKGFECITECLVPSHEREFTGDVAGKIKESESIF